MCISLEVYHFLLNDHFQDVAFEADISWPAGEEQAVMEGSPLSGGSYCNYKRNVLTPERNISLLKVILSVYVYFFLS